MKNWRRLCAFTPPTCSFFQGNVQSLIKFWFTWTRKQNFHCVAWLCVFTPHDHSFLGEMSGLIYWCPDNCRLSPGQPTHFLTLDTAGPADSFLASKGCTFKWSQIAWRIEGLIKKNLIDLTKHMTNLILPYHNIWRVTPVCSPMTGMTSRARLLTGSSTSKWKNVTQQVRTNFKRNEIQYKRVYLSHAIWKLDL